MVLVVHHNYHQLFTKQQQVWLADDATGAGKIKLLHDWFQNLTDVGPDHGYFVNGPKSWLIVKTEELEAEAKQVFGETVNVTTEGKRHLGAVIGSKSNKDEYCKGKGKGKW